MVIKPTIVAFTKYLITVLLCLDRFLFFFFLFQSKHIYYVARRRTRDSNIRTFRISFYINMAIRIDGIVPI